ncbi:23S rRNA (uracil(1939)-C(5))-methyltransferase RlmD [Candidatus Saganbacteria bacterium]|nr:23S rRNA (uracil(1939)-C(5))-methyltransferase RlmD [Candidatus Saganbacteria bacterium]
MNNGLCNHFGVCGGCKLQDIPYSDQLKTKEQTIKELFGESSPIIPSSKEFFYRNRMDFAIGPNFTAGLKNNKNNIINIEECLLMSEESNKILERLRYFMQWKKLESYYTELPKQPRGIMRHMVIREGKNIKNTVINIITSNKGEFPLGAFWEKVQDLVQGVVWSINLSPADRSFGEIQKSFGQDHYMESLNGIKFKIPIQSFFQTNTYQGESLIKVVKEFANPKSGERIYDMYSGTGSIGLSLAKDALEVIGIEENEPAAKLSLENAELNGIKNYSVISGRVEDIVTKGHSNIESDILILDPPRPGANKKVIARIIDVKPKTIVYVSCNPTSQKFDIDKLLLAGYKIKKIQPLDMFPHTPHIENIILLRLA